MNVRIKRLELHGFKSFPRSTVFEFDTGITAIIGPNGSGKSNIADAMRWVLGEQSYSNLRGRKAEDVIFSGSSARAPVGMAEVTLTLDNASGELPIDFQEVSITRRAYRSGENQYLINGARVRLKDVNQITASLGQSHTVIGQGLVDAALSQRPEERRSLFEHAAGITGLRLKYAATARHLNETETNSTRLEDLLNELEPRLRTLERQAKQAREYAAVQSELRETALTYYSTLWREHVARLDDLNAAVSRTDEALQEMVTSLQRHESSIASLESRLQGLRDRSSELEEQVDRRRSHQRELEHRIELARQRRETLCGELRRIEGSRTGLSEESEQIDVQRQERQQNRESIGAELASLREQLAQRQADRDALDRQIRERTTELRELDAERERLRQRIYRIEAEREYRQQQREDLTSRVSHVEERRREIEQELDVLRHNLEEYDARGRQMEQQRQEASDRIEALVAECEQCRQTVQSLQQEIEKIEGERARVAARLDALQRLQESGEGLYRGVQSVLDAARAGRLDGIIGTLAGQIKVPSEIENAIEAALGGHLQDIVTRRWSDAEAAITHLKRSNAGRATFQPLDTVRNFGNQNRPPISGEPGVHGIAVDLVDFEQELGPVLQGLLGRVVVTDDLAATRRILPKLRPGWTIVTLDGEVSRSGGSVTGGSRVRQSGTLSRERELRELPEALARLDSQRETATQRLSEAEARRSQSDADLEVARNDARARESEVDRVERERDSLQSRIAEREDQLRRIDEERAGAERASESRVSEIEELTEEYQRATTALEAADERRTGIVAQIEQLQETGDDEELRRLESEQSRLSERDQGLAREIESLEARARRIRADIARLDQDQSSASETIAQLGRDLDDLQSQVEIASTEVAELETQLEPLGGQESELRQQIETERREIDRLRQRHHELERARDQQRFDVQRQETQGELLLERAADVLEVEDPRPLLDDQPVVDGLDMKELETRLHRLRQRARRIGAFGEDTIAQYEQEQERYTFLRGQLDDVQRGAEALQAMLAELERSMTLEFDRTFGQVAQAFEVTFQRLFGGGNAKLVRTDDDESIGIDIVAQPPGKRLQSLALLSGGERALTAVALLFAILRVNPSPFCLLDEVDAALDEANVVRFRDELRDLSKETQFVVVTHNRATIEGADVLYGITMGSDAVSRVVSLKLPPEPAVASD